MKKAPRDQQAATEAFHPAVREWFAESFPAPTRAQSLGWAEIQAGRSTLVFAPTGSGKTLAAFLSAIDRLMFSPVPEKKRRCRVVYISPLRALAVDVERNLRAPLAGISRAAERRGDAFHLPAIALRTGDTPAKERARIARTPPDILITTPESLFLVLTSQAHSLLVGAEVVIVDEIHALVGGKRGAHLALSLERLQELAAAPLQRIGLSATQRPLDEVARYLGGYTGVKHPEPRLVSIVDAGAKKRFDLRVEVPVEDMARMGPVPAVAAEPAGGKEPTDPAVGEAGAEDAAGDDFQEGPAAAVPAGRSIWPAIHPRLLELIRAHQSTLLFVNSRRLAERLAAALNELAGEEIVRAHHGSLAREQRLVIEDQLKAGTLPALVATSSLELGIDMGAIDLVVQIETPPSVASGLQRIGRAGHQSDAVSRGVIFPKYRGDLLSTAAITRAMQEGAVEATRVPQNPLDVLAQQVVAICAMGERTVSELFALAKRTAPFVNLPRAQLEGVLDMLSGRYPSDEFAELRPRLVWDRLKGTVRAREGALRLAVTNAGTIPDRGLYGVFLADGKDAAPGARPTSRRVGELDEEMVFESRAGEVFVLGASSWRIVEIERDRVLVVPAPGEPGKMPFWHGDRPPRPVELGRAVGKLTRELSSRSPEEGREQLITKHALEPRAADNLLAYLADQREATGTLPDDRTLVLERSRDEMGDWRLCLLSPWGGRVHAPWALVLQARLRAAGESDTETIWSDDGIVLRLPERESPPDASFLLPDPDEIEDLLIRELGGTALFAAHFREAASRALLLPRRRPGQRSPLWMQRKRAADLLAVAARYGSFPIILETYRECLQDVFDLPGLLDIAKKLQSRELRIVTVDTALPSPFAASLLFGYVSNYIYEGDAPLAERRAQALAVDQAQLRELLGESELRQLLDPDVLAETELELQALVSSRRARSADRLHELLQRIGDLSEAELMARVEAPEKGEHAGQSAEGLAALWAAELVQERRAIRLSLGGEERLVAAEDAGRMRDAFGIPPPRGLPGAFLETQPNALTDVVARYARTHGPFTAAEAAHRFGVGEGPLTTVLRALSAANRVLEGEFRPGGRGREWCASEVLTLLRRRSLAKLRKQVEPAEPTALARLLADWQGIVTTARTGAPRQGADALLDVVEQMQGAAVPASALEADILPARLPAYRTQDLDMLCAAGEVVWVGVSPLGERDGRLALYLADHRPLLQAPLAAAEDRPQGETHVALREHLSRAGASFFADLQAAVGGSLSKGVLDALWDLVWAGEVTSDSPEALRAFLRPKPVSRGPARPRRSGAFRSRRQSPPSGVGRWTLVHRPGEEAPTVTRRLKALSEQLLARSGVLTRQAVMAENLSGGFSALYPVLKALEESGRVRRGYFVAGLGGSQFALPGALDRLRTLKDTAASALDEGDGLPSVVLAATDPANPYGSLLTWPKETAGRPQRGAGAHVVLVDGRLAAYVARGEREVTPFLPAEEPLRSQVAQGLAAALAAWGRRTGRSSIGWNASDEPLVRSVLAPFLRDAGYVPWGPGFRLDAPLSVPQRRPWSGRDAGLPVPLPESEPEEDPDAEGLDPEEEA